MWKWLTSVNNVPADADADADDIRRVNKMFGVSQNASHLTSVRYGAQTEAGKNGEKKERYIGLTSFVPVFCTQIIYVCDCL